MPEPTQAEMIQELFRRRSELKPDEGAMVEELMKRMTASGEIRGAEPGQQRLPPGLTGAPEAPREQPQMAPALSRFFSGLSEIVTGPIAGLKEYIDRPANIAAAIRTAQTEPGTPAHAEAMEQAMNAPLSNPLAYETPAFMGPGMTASGKLSQGDIAGAAGTLAGAYGVPAALGYGTAKVISPEARARGGQMVRRGVEELETRFLGPREPVKMMNQALRPINRNIQFDQAVDTALPEIKASEANIGRPISNIRDMLEALKDAKKRVWEQRTVANPALAQRRFSGDSVADAIEGTVTKRMEMHDPAKVESIKAMANKYRGRTFTIQEAEELLHGANDELSSYYAKNPLMRRIEEGRNPDTAALAAEARLLRDRIYGELDQAGQGAGPRELSRRYGALLNMEGEIYRRMKVADRQAQYSLAEQLATAQGMAEAGVGVLTGHPVMAAVGLARKELAKEMKEAMQTDRLIERTFRNYNRKPLTVTWQPTEPRALLAPPPHITPPPADPSSITVTTGPPLQPKIRGVLPAPPLITPPPPDPSGITVTTGPPLRPRTLGELAAPPLVTPPPADLSGIEVVDAARGIARDPKTGRLFRYYTSQRRE